MALVLEIVFMLWIAVTVICQFRTRLTDGLRRLDVLALIPIWTFFSPNPLQHDLALAVRAIGPDGRVGGWTALMPTAPVGWRRLRFNAYRRARKALVDLVLQHSQERDENLSRGTLQLSLPYIVLLDEATRWARQHNAAGVQFALVATQGGTPVERLEDAAVLVSEAHPVDSEMNACVGNRQRPGARHAT